MTEFSVLMSVYHAENPQFLVESFDSIERQTWQPSEIVLVEDGPLTPALEAVIQLLRDRFSSLRTVQLAENQGLGAALNAGLAACRYELVARMDTDDIAVPWRFERQIKEVSNDTTLSLVGSYVAEFEHDPRHVERVRAVPVTHEEIRSAFARRCPVNHPSVVFRKSAVQSVGGYSAKYAQEDYYLWGRMLATGQIFKNIPEPLVLMRCGSGLYGRRGGVDYAMSEARLQWEFHALGLTSVSQLLVNAPARFAVRLLPGRMRKSVYTRFLRHSSVSTGSVTDSRDISP